MNCLWMNTEGILSVVVTYHTFVTVKHLRCSTASPTPLVNYATGYTLMVTIN
jgi:hypothetical protein